MSVDTLRREIVELLAISNDVKAVSLAMRGTDEDVNRLAKDLSVLPELILEAVSFAREGFGGSAQVGSLVQIDSFIPNDVFVCADQLAYSHKMHKPRHLMRSLMHTAMQQENEPHERKKWLRAIPGSEAHRARLLASAKKRDEKKYEEIGCNGKVHVYVTLSRGLLKAIDMRATAYGATRSRYVLLWLSDLVDGQLREWPLHDIGDGQMFDSEKSYVIPAQFSPRQ